ncbi:MAG: TonB-dependent receptor plug domain-containing protein [Acidihalobacter sp.]
MKPRPNKKAHAALLLPIALAVTNAQATSVPATQNQAALGQLNILITQGRRPIQPNSPATIHTITRKELQARGARNLNQALALVPGLNVRNGAQGVPRIDIRGLRTRQIKLLINGIPYNSTYDGQFDPTQFPVAEIARIEVITGAPSVLYGDGAIAGVINVVTRKGRGPAHGSLSAETGLGGYRSTHANLAGSKGRWDYFVSVGRQVRHGFPLSHDFQATPYEDGGIRNNSDRRRKNAYANVGLRVTPDFKLGLTVSHVDGANGIPPSTQARSATDPFAHPVRYERIDGLNGNSVQLAGTFDPPGAWTSRFWVYYNRLGQTANRYDNAQYDSMSDPTIKGTYSLHSTSRITGLHDQVSYLWTQTNRLTFGVNGRRESWSQNGVIRDVSSSSGGGGGRRGSSADRLRRLSGPRVCKPCLAPCRSDARRGLQLATPRREHPGGDQRLCRNVLRRDAEAAAARLGVAPRTGAVHQPVV